MPVCAVPGTNLGKIKNDWHFDRHATLEQAVALRDVRNLSGIGWYIRADLDSIVGVDLDGCIRDGELTTFASEFLTRAGEEVYVEVSPSGRGLRAFVRCDNWFESIGRNIVESRAGIEIYVNKRYLTLTGRCLRGAGVEKIGEGEEVLRWLVEKAGRNWATVPGNGLHSFSRIVPRDADSTLKEISEASRKFIPSSVQIPYTNDGRIDRSITIYRIAQALYKEGRSEAEIVAHIEKCDCELWSQQKYAGREYEYTRIAQKISSGKRTSGRNFQAVTSQSGSTYSVPGQTCEAERISLCDSLLTCAVRMPWPGTTGITDFFVYSSLLLFARECGRLTGRGIELVLDQRSNALFAGIARDTLAKSVRRLRAAKLVLKTKRKAKTDASSYTIRIPEEWRTPLGHGTYTGGVGGSGPGVCAALCRVRRFRANIVVGDAETPDDLRITKLGGLILARLGAEPATLDVLAASLDRRARCIRDRYLDSLVRCRFVVVTQDVYSVANDIEERILDYLDTSGMLAAETAQAERHERQREKREEQLEEEAQNERKSGNPPQNLSEAGTVTSREQSDVRAAVKDDSSLRSSTDSGETREEGDDGRWNRRSAM